VRGRVRKRGKGEQAAVVLPPLKGEWCKNFWSEFFPQTLSFGPTRPKGGRWV
jgi:hypothetical protein